MQAVMDDITVDEIREAVSERSITWLSFHACSICRAPVGYVIDGDSLFYDSACGCTTYRSPPEPRDWDDLARLFNRQEPEIRQRMWGDLLNMGGPLPAPPEDTE